MKNTNIGVANLIVSNKLKNSYFDSKLINESKKMAFDFFDVIKNSPILKLEFKIFDNIENKHINNDLIATRYIDSNIKLFEVYTIDEIENECSKLNRFINENVVDFNDVEQKKIKLYTAIDNLIRESLTDYLTVDVDTIHESFEIILNHIKTVNTSLTINEDVDHDVDDTVIEIAVNKFNEKYSSLSEDDRHLIKQLIDTTNVDKKSILETYKIESIEMLNNANNENFNEKINAAIKKINEISYAEDTVIDNIIDLHELKKGRL